MKNNKKMSRGITLIALVVTIIVLLILAGISIAMLSGNNGILQRATDAKQATERSEAKEQAQLDILDWISDKSSKNEDSTLNDSKIKAILTGKSYVKEANDSSFITAKGEYEIPYSELYKSVSQTPTIDFALLRSTIENYNGNNVQININGEISNVVWMWSPLNNEECYIFGDDDYEVGESNGYSGIIINGEIKDDFPIFIKYNSKVYRVTSIGDLAFFYMTSLEKLAIPDGVKQIDKRAFYGCSSLSNLTIGNDVTSIGEYAFYRCSFENLVLPNSLTNIGYEAFYECTNLTNLTIPNSVQTIGYGAFKSCTNLTTVNYLGTVEQWNEINIDSHYNDSLTNTKIICTNGTIN